MIMFVRFYISKSPNHIKCFFDAPFLYHSQVHEVCTLFVHVKMQGELVAAAQTIPSVLVFGQCLLFWWTFGEKILLFSPELREYLVRKNCSIKTWIFKTKILLGILLWAFRWPLLRMTAVFIFISCILLCYTNQIYRWRPTCPVSLRNSWWEVLYNHMGKTHYC